MSSTNRGGDRSPLDAYYTPDLLAAKLVGLLPIRRGDTAWEPHAGGGAFVRALLARRCVVFLSDIAPDAAAYGCLDAYSMPERDALDGFPFVDDPPEWIVGNPPFRGFERHIDAALAVAPNVAFLLRLAAMESGARVDCWRRWPLRKVWVLAERPSFTGSGTDSAAYGFFWFQRGYVGSSEVVPGWSWKG